MSMPNFEALPAQEAETKNMDSQIEDVIKSKDREKAKELLIDILSKEKRFEALYVNFSRAENIGENLLPLVEGDSEIMELWKEAAMDAIRRKLLGGSTVDSAKNYVDEQEVEQIFNEGKWYNIPDSGY